MNIFERAKNILITPGKEWSVIENEDANSSHVLTYLLLLALIPAICSLIGFGFIGYNVLGVRVGTMSWGINQAIITYLSMVGGVYLSAFVIDFLASKFEATSSFNVAFKLVAYSYTPMCVAGIFYLFPALSVLVPIGGLYGLYILYIGMKPMLKVSNEKHMTYFIVSLICIIVVSAVLGAILGVIFATNALAY